MRPAEFAGELRAVADQLDTMDTADIVGALRIEPSGQLPELVRRRIVDRIAELLDAPKPVLDASAHPAVHASAQLRGGLVVHVATDLAREHCPTCCRPGGHRTAQVSLADLAPPVAPPTALVARPDDAVVVWVTVAAGEPHSHVGHLAISTDDEWTHTACGYASGAGHVCTAATATSLYPGLAWCATCFPGGTR